MTFETFQRIKQLFALRLKEMEDEAEAARAVAAAATGGAAGAGAEGGDAMETDENRSTLAAGAEELAGCRQGELVKWYLDERNAAGAFQTAVRPRSRPNPQSLPLTPSSTPAQGFATATRRAVSLCARV